MNLDKRELELRDELDQALINGEDTTEIRKQLNDVINKIKDQERLEHLNKKQAIKDRIKKLEQEVERIKAKRKDAKEKIPIVSQEMKDLESQLEERKKEMAYLKGIASRVISAEPTKLKIIKELKAELKSM